MIKYENECCGCATESYPCNPWCKRKKVPHFFCDRCGDEYNENELKYINGQQYCDSCFDELYGD
jgi:formylmethanofuran dehydrogenase subunit E